jgi:hypothetical protein
MKKAGLGKGDRAWARAYKKAGKELYLGLFQNPVGAKLRFDEPGAWKNQQNRTKVRPGFSVKFKGIVPKAEVLEPPHLAWFSGRGALEQEPQPAMTPIRDRIGELHDSKNNQTPPVASE